MQGIAGLELRGTACGRNEYVESNVKVAAFPFGLFFISHLPGNILEFRGKFDVIICVFSLEEFPAIFLISLTPGPGLES